MSRSMTKEEAQAWKRRWDAVTARQRTETRQETYAERFRALAWLMASASLFDMQALADEDATARTRWARLQSLARDR